MRVAYHRIRRSIATLLMLSCLAASGCARPDVLQRALSYSQHHDEARALQVLREYLRKHPDELPPRRLLIRLLAASSNVPEALHEVEELARHVPPGDPSALLERGHVLELNHQFDEALAAYDAAADLAPHDARGPREGGPRSAHWGEAAEALPRLEEAARRGAKDSDFWHALGAVKASLGDAAGARVAYTRVAAADPDRIEGLVGLASLSLSARDHAGALREYDALVKLRPRDPTFVLSRAYCLARLGRVRDAEVALQKATELGASATHVAKIRTLLQAS